MRNLRIAAAAHPRRYAHYMKTAKTLALVIGLGFVSAQASACLCPGPAPSTEVLFSTHALVFVGQVVSGTEVTKGKKDWPHMEFILFPTEVFKGDGKKKEIKMLDYKSTCDMGYKIGSKYLIYAKPVPDGSFYTGTCDYSKKLPDESADTDLKWIRKHLKTKKASTSNLK